MIRSFAPLRMTSLSLVLEGEGLVGGEAANQPLTHSKHLIVISNCLLNNGGEVRNSCLHYFPGQ
ncbi:MAG: hypothetical protein HC905_16995 [Bacteroidales bacterium]|nr:hypothetical protein [Bacteroidales bacterium]